MSLIFAIESESLYFWSGFNSFLYDISHGRCMVSHSARVVMTLLVRNEQDVIVENILFHHRQGVDSFIVMDNASDATVEIVRELAHSTRLSCVISAMTPTTSRFGSLRWLVLQPQSMEQIGLSTMMPMNSGCFRILMFAIIPLPMM